MKIAKTLLYVLVVAGAVVAFGWFFVSQLGSGGQGDGLAGVLLSPPPGYAIVDRGELPPTAAAAELQSQLLAGDKVGVKFKRGGAVVYWLADVPAGRLEERSAGPGGTRLQTVWQGGLGERLRWAREHGDFSVPGMAAGEKKNLYH